MNGDPHDEKRLEREKLWQLVLEKRRNGGRCEKCGVRHRPEVPCFLPVRNEGK